MTLFLLPFPPTNISKNPTTTPHLNSTSTSTQNKNKNKNKNKTTNLTTLLTSQPLLRGDAYLPYLGPTGNINAVLAARQLIWGAFKALGELTLSSPEDEEGVDNTREEKDAEDFRKVIASIEETLSDWKEKLVGGEAERKVVPPGGEVEDALIVEFDGWKIRVGDDNDDGVVGDGGDVDMDDGYSAALGQKKKRRSSRSRTKPIAKDDMDADVEDMLLRVDWACLGCGGSI